MGKWAAQMASDLGLQPCDAAIDWTTKVKLTAVQKANSVALPHLRQEPDSIVVMVVRLPGPVDTFRIMARTTGGNWFGASSGQFRLAASIYELARMAAILEDEADL